MSVFHQGFVVVKGVMAFHRPGHLIPELRRTFYTFIFKLRCCLLKVQNLCPECIGGSAL